MSLQRCSDPRNKLSKREYEIEKDLLPDIHPSYIFRKCKLKLPAQSNPRGLFFKYCGKLPILCTSHHDYIGYRSLLMSTYIHALHAFSLISGFESGFVRILLRSHERYVSWEVRYIFALTALCRSTIPISKQCVNNSQGPWGSNSPRRIPVVGFLLAHMLIDQQYNMLYLYLNI